MLQAHKKLDKLWIKDNGINFYSSVSKMDFGLISCFDCPVVKPPLGWFMKQQIEWKCQPNLSAQKKTSIKFFWKKDLRKIQVDPNLIFNMVTDSAKRYKEKKNEVKLTQTGIKNPILWKEKQRKSDWVDQAGLSRTC